jgi:hypothetical protein
MLDGVSFRGVIGRSVLFVCWALVGAVASYGLLYLLSPYGLIILAIALGVGLMLPRRFESVGLIAGPGLLLMLAGQYGEPVLFAVGVALVAVAVMAYGVIGRARCARAS